MEYRKPEILLIEDAAAAIQSSLDKNVVPTDSNHIDPETGAGAYEADE
jgi:hypothetical protein